MNEDTFTFDGSDGQSIHVYRWTGDGTPRAIVQLAHGFGGNQQIGAIIFGSRCESISYLGRRVSDRNLIW